MYYNNTSIGLPSGGTAWNLYRRILQRLGGRLAEKEFVAGRETAHLVEAVILRNLRDSGRVSVSGEEVFSSCVIPAQDQVPTRAQAKVLEEGVFESTFGSPCDLLPRLNVRKLHITMSKIVKSQKNGSARRDAATTDGGRPMRQKNHINGYGSIFLMLTCMSLSLTAIGQTDKPNILILFPDDVGWQNVSAYGRGTMGYRTPNIDRIAREGALFTDHYAQPSCTAGRAALITGQYPIRSGMTTVGRPGAELGLKPQSHTLAEVLKELGYATGQFGKNHLGDRNEHLPTVHGFDEFFGNLYHLNTQEEFEQVDYPKDPDFFKKFGTRGVLRTKATDVDDQTIDPRFGKVGKQTIEDTGQLTRERMKTADREFIDATLDFIKRAKDGGKPFFVWFNPSRMHMYTRLSDESRYLAAEYTTEHDFYGSGLIEHDRQIGEMLDALEEMGVLDNTIVVYSTDNGPEHSARLHGGTTPFRGEKMTTYEGGVRVPMMVRWPGKIPADTVLSGIQTHMDIYTTLAAAAGEPEIAQRVLTKHKQPIDGVNNLDYWMGKTDESARDHYFYYYESSIKAIRYKQWKLHFETSENYYAPYVKQKFPVMYNVRMDPFESFDGVTDRSDIVQAKQWLNEPVQHLLGEHIKSLTEYPPVQKAASFDFSALMEQLMSGKQ